MAQNIVLHFWPTPNGQKISIALEEMGLSYEVKLVNIGAGEQFDPDFLGIAPNNRIPAIVDPNGPDGAPISLFESGAILQYLARKTGRFGGVTAREQAEVEQWLMWQMGGLGPMAGQANHFLRYAPQMDPPQVLPYAQERYARETNRLLGVLNTRLKDRAFVAGEALTIADFAIYPWAVSCQNSYGLPEGSDALSAWITRMGARDAVARGMAVSAEKRQASLDQKAIDNLYKR